MNDTAHSEKPAADIRAGGWVNLPGLGSYYLRGTKADVKTLWVQYTARVNGKKKGQAESAHFRVTPATTDEQMQKVAIKLLRQRHAEQALGKEVGPSINRTTFADVQDIVTRDYKTKGRRSLKRMKFALAHLNEYFGGSLARNITDVRLVAYQEHRQEQKAANAAINYELAILRRAFRLALRAKLVVEVPYFEKLEAKVRTGFFKDAEFEAVLSELRDYLRPLAKTYFITGWRREEVLSRKKHHVDLDGGWLRLEPGETKNGEGRNFPLTVRLKEVLSEQLAKTRALEEASGRIIPWLFHRNGAQIKCFRTAWNNACRRAGVSGRLVHDFRRTAVRNLESDGVSRSAAMAMVGHKTQAIYFRYAISDSGSLKASALKMDEGDAERASTKAATNVVSIESAKKAAAQ